MRAFLRGMGDPRIGARLWDGEEAARLPAPPAAGMVIHDRSTLWRLVANPLLNFGDDYSAGRIGIEGRLVDFMEAVCRAMENSRRCARRVTNRYGRGEANTISASRDNIHHHYDLSNAFYQMWLDREMLYTCAYYPRPEATLEEAQIAKMELVCRKLRLRAGQSVVEAGCGWGGLARHMARHYGVRVRSFNISGEQIAYARDRAREEGLDGLVEYVEDDYRNISGQYDAFVSVGMLEHVGVAHYRELGEVIHRCLTPEGIGLIHSIGQVRGEPMSPWLLKRIFPGSYPPTLGEMMEIFQPWGFSVLDVENLRLHYARTLEQWLERFEANREKVAEMFDDCFVRAWRLYLAGAVANFTVGSLQLFQVVFASSGNNQVPWTRSHLGLGGVADG
ncbi:MAG TPA: cyclopropane-fatty-acyl-phospholipid synthase family protein [Desulfuromonadaceae bacterium]